MIIFFVKYIFSLLLLIHCAVPYPPQGRLTEIPGQRGFRKYDVKLEFLEGQDGDLN